MRHGAQSNPPNRFEAVRHVPDPEHFEHAADDWFALQDQEITYFVDSSKSIVSENDSPDIPFRYSINPYRGCAHGCTYCYARNTHEYFGLSAGLDFETKIFVKEDAPKLFRDFLAKPGFEVGPIAFSGVTDCYQPAERRFRLTRGCLEVALAHGVPVGIVTKNALVARDIDLLAELARRKLARVYLSIGTLNAELARSMEPRASIPEARLRAIRELAGAGVPVGVMTAPIVPGLNEEELPTILAAAHNAGARSAGYTMLRLPLTVEPVFREWLRLAYPDKVSRVEGRIRSMRDGEMSSSTWGERMSGKGVFAGQIAQMFRLHARRIGINGRLPEYDRTQFVPPLKHGQKRLF